MLPEQQQPPTPELQPAIEPPKKGKKKVLKVILALLLIGLICGGIYLLQQQRLDELSKTNQDLSTQLSTAKKDAETAKGADEKPVETKPESSTVVYKAEVGKFTLTLPEQYVVVRKNDGGGEGGPSTILLLAEKSPTTGVVLSPIWDEVTMTAYNLEAGMFRGSVDATLKDRDPKKQAPVTLDGVTAEVYLLNGFSQPKEIFFTKNDIMYSIKAVDNSESANKKIDAIVAGFKFN